MSIPNKNIKKVIVIGVMIAFIILFIIISINQKENAENKSTTQEETSTQQEEDTSTELNPDNIQIGKEINTTTDANKSTEFILLLVWDTYSKIYPNAKWVTFEIQETDGYGRYLVYVKYLKNTSDTTYTYAHNIVWWVDESNFGRYTTTGTVNAMKSQVDWGTQIQ